MPYEEADWHGLTLFMAHEKQKALEHLEEKKAIVPRRQQYQRELVALLEEGYLDEIDPALLYADEDKDSTVKDGFKKLFKLLEKKMK